MTVFTIACVLFVLIAWAFTNPKRCYHRNCVVAKRIKVNSSYGKRGGWFLFLLCLSACTGSPDAPQAPDAAPDAPDICRECYCYTSSECSTSELNLACGCPKGCVIGPLETCRTTLANDGGVYFCC